METVPQPEEEHLPAALVRYFILPIVVEITLRQIADPDNFIKETKE